MIRSGRDREGFAFPAGEIPPNVAITVFKREDLYRGPYLDQAPDLIYVINDFRCVSRQSFTRGLVFERRSLRENYTGTHRLEGMMIVKGPHIKRGYGIGKETSSMLRRRCSISLRFLFPRIWMGRFSRCLNPAA